MGLERVPHGLLKIFFIKITERSSLRSSEKRFIYNSRIVIQTQLWESWGMNQTIEMFTINKNISFILNYSQSKLHHIVIHVLKFARCC